MNCNSFNIIYLITCNKCKVQYVGQTSRKLKDRLNDHCSNVNTYKQTAISIHFISPQHTIQDIKIMPIELVKHTTLRVNRELHWIKTLKTKYPYGLNSYPIIK